MSGDQAARKHAGGAPPLTPAEAEALIDALLGFRAALMAHDGVRLPSLAEFIC